MSGLSSSQQTIRFSYFCHKTQFKKLSKQQKRRKEKEKKKNIKEEKKKKKRYKDKNKEKKKEHAGCFFFLKGKTEKVNNFLLT